MGLCHSVWVSNGHLESLLNVPEKLLSGKFKNFLTMGSVLVSVSIAVMKHPN